MTDNEIIKALECCTSDKCLECPLKNIPKVSGCMALMTSALKLINRQKAEIRKYKNCYEQVKWERDMFEEDLQTAKAEIERLQSIVIAFTNEVCIDDNGYYVKELSLEVILDNAKKAKANTKAEAVKEFAEDVKIAFYYQFDELIPSIMADKIDELVKKAGDNDE